MKAIPGRQALAVLLATLLVLALAGSAGAWQRQATMPNVKGKQLKTAQYLLKLEGFETVNIFTVETDKRGLAGVVQSQSPAAGSVSSVGVTVKLTVYEYAP
ncbi:MAG: PASTA domain-containing protein [Pseudomonadota bacterium]